ncbi:MAG: winged helix-turn-helix transcriptional regulator [Bacteroidota bacterium]|nr:winged helix-turn-helix transcriptional regulator [Bacteroidota bacterium]
MNIENQVISYLNQQGEATIVELTEHIGVSRQMLHRVVKRMLEDNYLVKLGKPPKVFYKLQKTVSAKQLVHLLNEIDISFLEEHFLLITETGERLKGIDAMNFWSTRQKLPFEKTAKEFISTKKKYLQYFLPNGLIDGTDKIKNTKGFEKIAVDKMFYCDFYAIERFGKTVLGTLLHFAKQGQNKKLMNEIIAAVKEPINRLIQEKKIDAVGFIPPTIKRHLQFMQVLQKGLNLPLPHINIVKVSGAIPVPQKALSKIEDRIINAQVSIIVKDTRKFNKILLIDDAVGSGATINETAVKLKFKETANTVIGLAVTGSFKGFDVIQEV